MPVRLSRFYNDPNIGQGFQNLAGAFAPPDGTEMLAGAKAVAEQQKARRLAEFYDLSKSPTVTRQQIENQGIGAGLFNPGQGYYAVDQGNATTLRTNAADNARALQVARMQESGQLDRAMIAPIGQDQVRNIPSGIAGMYGTPQVQYGLASLQQGEKQVRPDGTVLQGNDKPLSEADVKGAILAGLPQGDQRVAVLGSTPVENVVGADGKPQIAFRADAVGQQPAATPVAPQSATNYRTPDGAEGTAVLKNGGLVDSQTQQPIPQGSRQFSTAVQGTKDETGLGTGNVNKAGQQLLDIQIAEDALNKHEALIKASPGALGGLGAARRTFQDIVSTGGELAEVLKKSDVDVQNLISQGRIAPDVMKRFGNFDPNLPAIEASRQRLIAALAAATSSDGNVSNRDVARIEAQVGGNGVFSGDQDALARLGATRADLQSRRGFLQKANPQAGANFPGATAPVAPAPAQPTAAPAQPEQWVRDSNGKLVRAP